MIVILLLNRNLTPILSAVDDDLHSIRYWLYLAISKVSPLIPLNRAEDLDDVSTLLIIRFQCI